MNILKNCLKAVWDAIILQLYCAPHSAQHTATSGFPHFLSCHFLSLLKYFFFHFGSSFWNRHQPACQWTRKQKWSASFNIQVLGHKAENFEERVVASYRSSWCIISVHHHLQYQGKVDQPWRKQGFELCLSVIDYVICLLNTRCMSIVHISFWVNNIYSLRCISCCFQC